MQLCEGLSRIWHIPHRDLRLILRDMFLCQERNSQLFILCHTETVAMCVCVKHVIVGCCFVSLFLGTSIWASEPVRICGQVQAIIFSQSFCIILEVCIRFNNSFCKWIINWLCESDEWNSSAILPHTVQWY